MDRQSQMLSSFKQRRSLIRSNPVDLHVGHVSCSRCSDMVGYLSIDVSSRFRWPSDMYTLAAL